MAPGGAVHQGALPSSSQGEPRSGHLESPTVESQLGLCLAASNMAQHFHDYYVRGSWGRLAGAEEAGRELKAVFGT